MASLNSLDLAAKIAALNAHVDGWRDGWAGREARTCHRPAPEIGPDPVEDTVVQRSYDRAYTKGYAAASEQLMTSAECLERQASLARRRTRSKTRPYFSDEFEVRVDGRRRERAYVTTPRRLPACLVVNRPEAGNRDAWESVAFQERPGAEWRTFDRSRCVIIEVIRPKYMTDVPPHGEKRSTP